MRGVREVYEGCLGINQQRPTGGEGLILVVGDGPSSARGMAAVDSRIVTPQRRQRARLCIRGVLGRISGVMGCSKGVVGCIKGVLGRITGVLGCTKGILGCMRGALGCIGVYQGCIGMT
jgi:hypothetical protein